MKLDIKQEECNYKGVYKILNIKTGDFYIGSTRQSFKRRYKRHIYNFLDKQKRRSCPILYKAFDKYGLENFEFSILFISNIYEIILKEEEYLINTLNPKYNICKYPTRGGLPNLGRKLNKEWREKIKEKSKLYKHKNNTDTYNKKVLQNKELSSVYKIYNDSEETIGSSVDICKKYNIKQHIFYRIFYKPKETDNFKIIKISSQKKKIKLIKENEEIVLDSFGKCDKFLKMWRGYTSTQICRKNNKLLDYNYILL